MKANNIRDAYDKKPLDEVHRMYRDLPDKDAIDEYKHRNKSTAKNMADMLFSLGDPQPAAVNNNGKSALDIATETDNEPLVKYLLGKM